MVRPTLWLTVLLVCFSLVSIGRGSIILGQADDFEDGTTQGWTGGASPTNIATGGPGGLNDNYLQISALSSNLGTFNVGSRWTGDFSAANAIRMDLNNFGPNAVDLRLMLLDSVGGNFASTNAITLAASSGWTNALFLLDAGSMTHVGGGSGVFGETLLGVDRLLLRHDSGVPNGPGFQNPVTATLGIDNIQGVPEPSSLVLLGLVALSVGVATQRRRRKQDPAAPRVC